MDPEKFPSVNTTSTVFCISFTGMQESSFKSKMPHHMRTVYYFET